MLNIISRPNHHSNQPEGTQFLIDSFQVDRESWPGAVDESTAKMVDSQRSLQLDVLAATCASLAPTPGLSCQACTFCTYSCSCLSGWTASTELT